MRSVYDGPPIGTFHLTAAHVPSPTYEASSDFPGSRSCRSNFSPRNAALSLSAALFSCSGDTWLSMSSVMATLLCPSSSFSWACRASWCFKASNGTCTAPFSARIATRHVGTRHSRSTTVIGTVAACRVKRAQITPAPSNTLLWWRGGSFVIEVQNLTHPQQLLPRKTSSPP